MNLGLVEEILADQARRMAKKSSVKSIGGMSYASPQADHAVFVPLTVREILGEEIVRKPRVEISI
jgi:hypothetical protein